MNSRHLPVCLSHQTLSCATITNHRRKHCMKYSFPSPFLPTFAVRTISHAFCITPLFTMTSPNEETSSSQDDINATTGNTSNTPRSYEEFSARLNQILNPRATAFIPQAQLKSFSAKSLDGKERPIRQPTIPPTAEDLREGRAANFVWPLINILHL